MRFGGHPSTPHAGAKIQTKTAYVFQIPHFYGSFSNDVMAVKGLKDVKLSLSFRLMLGLCILKTYNI